MKIALVGATGMVGNVILQVLAERNFNITELIPVASERSVGKEISYQNKKYTIVSLQDAVNTNQTWPYFLLEVIHLWNGLQNLQPLELR